MNAQALRLLSRSGGRALRTSQQCRVATHPGQPVQQQQHHHLVQHPHQQRHQQQQQHRRSLRTSAATPNSTTDGASAPPTVLPQLQSKFCRLCGSPMSIIQPEGDKEWRHVCGSCSYVDYFNPKMVVGCCVQHEGKILLCRRAIEPCKGLWTIPAGFLELGESSAAGAARETLEEANAAVTVLGPYAHWDIPVIGQSYILFRAQLAAPFTFSAGTESLEVGLFEPSAIPWGEIAFSSVAITLRSFVADMASGSWHIHHGVIDRKPNAAPNDPDAYVLRDHFSSCVGASTHIS